MLGRAIRIGLKRASNPSQHCAKRLRTMATDDKYFIIFTFVNICYFIMFRLEAKRSADNLVWVDLIAPHLKNNVECIFNKIDD